MADGNADHLAPGVLARPGGDRVFHFQVHVAADVLQGIVPPHRARQEPGFEQDLEAIADARDVATAGGEPSNLFHDRREARDGAGAQVVAVGKPAGQDDHVGAAQIPVLVPDVARGAAKDVLGDVVDVVVAVRPGEDDHREEHQASSSMRYSSMTVLARSFSHMDVRRSLDAFARLGRILVVEIQLDDLPEPHILYLGKPESPERARDRLTLRIEHRLLQRDDHPGFHARAP